MKKEKKSKKAETPREHKSNWRETYATAEEGERGQLISATMALQMIGGNIAMSLSKTKIGQAFARLGFEYKRTPAQRGFVAVRRTGAELEAYDRMLAENDHDTMTP